MTCHLSRALAAVADRLDDAAAAYACQKAADRHLLFFAQPGYRDVFHEPWLSDSLSVVAQRLPPDAASGIAAQLLQAIEKTSDPDIIYTHAKSIAARLDTITATELCAKAEERIARAMRESRDPSLLHRYARARLHTKSLLPRECSLPLVALAADTLTDGSKLLTEGVVASYADEASDALAIVFANLDRVELARRVSRTFGMIPLGGGIACIPGVLQTVEPLSCPLATDTLVAMLHRPFTVLKTRRIILDILEARYHRHFRDQWDFVRFAQEQQLPLDFTAGPKRKLSDTLP
ncbi:MAG TPA: hypothetical protein PKD86_08925 [Gemmatales bacterium]|nr:hypothetical protein [Gemmatales bacterium]